MEELLERLPVLLPLACAQYALICDRLMLHRWRINKTLQAAAAAGLAD